MEIKELQNNIAKEELAILELEEKKNQIEKKISAKKEKIKDYTLLLQSKQYAKIDSQLSELGVSQEDLFNALRNNDLMSLQQLINSKSNVQPEGN